MSRVPLVLVSLTVVILVAACSEDGAGEEGASSTPAAAPATAESVAEEPVPTDERSETGPQGADRQSQEEPQRAEAESQEEPPAVDEASIAVVRAWSDALNAGDNAAAAELFAPDARVIQAGGSIPLTGHEAARRFNESLPCSGLIVDVSIADNVVTAVFELGHRETSRCDAVPGTLAAAQFLIEDGKILVWQQVPVPADDPASPRGAV